MYKVNLVGCGKVGRVLASLLHRCGIINTLSMASRSYESALSARQFVGTGDVYHSVDDLPLADIWIVASPDAQLKELDSKLARLESVRSGQIVFHCSGAYASSVLANVRKKGVDVASVHPIRSFADPALALESFAGTYCSLEGDTKARLILRNIFEKAGARVFEIAAEAKIICHAGHVFASNYLVVVLELARQLYRMADVPDEIARSCMESLAEGTLQNVSFLGTERALTGPVVRGEIEVVRAQHAAIALSGAQVGDAYIERIYALLGQVAIVIAENRGEVQPSVLEELSEILRSSDSRP